MGKKNQLNNNPKNTKNKTVFKNQKSNAPNSKQNTVQHQNFNQKIPPIPIAQNSRKVPPQSSGQTSSTTLKPAFSSTNRRPMIAVKS